MRVVMRAGAVVCSLAVGLAAVGCSSDTADSGSDSGSGSGTSSDAAITIDGTEPENGLVPANTTETGGGKVIDSLFTGLVGYKTEDSAPYNAVAESIDTKDSKVFTIKIKSGQKFHDGTDVKAKNFVDAWNWAAYSPNAAQNSSFFSDIQGFEDVQSEDPDEDGPKQAPKPKAEKLSGLKTVDDSTFEVTLGQPTAIFPTKLGYSAFKPLPDVFFTQTPKDFGEKPVGNGPFKLVQWDHDRQIKLTRFAEYALDDKAKVKDVTLKFYTDFDAAYADLQSNNLDFLQQVPPSAIAGDNYKNDLGERALERAVGVEQIIAYPIYDPKFKNADVRRAISMSIDRAQISEKIFNGTREPADSFVSPAVDGYKKGACGEGCTFDPAKAKELLAKGGGFSGKLTLTYNADGSHKEWMEASCNSIKQNLGVDCVTTPIATFAATRQKINAYEMTGMYRAGWQMDYPSIENFLNPLYRTNASSNDGKYTNPAVDAKLKEADGAVGREDSIAKYQEAEALIAADMPVIPMFFVKQQSGHSDKVKNVKVDGFGELDLAAIEAA